MIDAFSWTLWECKLPQDFSSQNMASPAFCWAFPRKVQEGCLLARKVWQSPTRDDCRKDAPTSMSPKVSSHDPRRLSWAQFPCMDHLTLTLMKSIQVDHQDPNSDFCSQELSTEQADLRTVSSQISWQEHGHQRCQHLFALTSLILHILHVKYRLTPWRTVQHGRFFLTSVVTELSYIERCMQIGSQRYTAQKKKRGNPVATHPYWPFFPYNTSTSKTCMKNGHLKEAKRIEGAAILFCLFFEASSFFVAYSGFVLMASTFLVFYCAQR